jgi:hypothetical protein
MLHYKLRTLLILLAVGPPMFAAGAGLEAAETGSLKMTFVYDGDPPPQRMFDIRGRGEAIADESLIVNQANRGIQNVCVWLLRTPGDLFAVDNGERREPEKRVLTLTGGNVSPRIAILRVPQTIVIRNTDSWGYNITSGGGVQNSPFSELLKPGDSIERRVEFREPNPVRLTSSIHPWVNGYILALDQPHAAISDADGRLTIKDIPIGKWGFVIWHERCAAVKKAVHAGQPIEWPGGLMWYTIKSGENDVGEFALAPAILRLK